MNELLPIGFMPPILPKELKEAYAAIDKQVKTLTDLRPEQQKQVREIARAFAKNNNGRLPDFPGIANHVRAHDPNAVPLR